jgi:hypothetical protein
MILVNAAILMIFLVPTLCQSRFDCDCDSDYLSGEQEKNKMYANREQSSSTLTYMVDIPDSEQNPEKVMRKMQKDQAILRLSTVIEDTPSKEFTR